MVKHIVLWKLKEEYTAEDKQRVFNELNTQLDDLLKTIKGFLAFEMGLSSNEKNVYDISLYSEFTDMEALNYYADHPEHVKVVKYLGEHVADRAAVDYQV